MSQKWLWSDLNTYSLFATVVNKTFPRNKKGDEPLFLLTHGCFCGPNNTLWNSFTGRKHVTYETNPTDELDQLCRRHDICWDEAVDANCDLGRSSTYNYHVEGEKVGQIFRQYIP